MNWKQFSIKMYKKDEKIIFINIVKCDKLMSHFFAKKM